MPEPRPLHGMRLRPPRQPRQMPRMRRDHSHGSGEKADRVKRRFFTFLSGLSLVLLIAALLSWPCSYLPRRCLNVARERKWVISVARGGFEFESWTAYEPSLRLSQG